MNIVLHIPSLQSGGAERQLMYLAKGLADISYNVHVVTFYSGGFFWDELERIPNVKLHSLNRKNKLDFSIIFKLARYCKNNEIDIVQAFLAPSAVIASFAVLMYKIPLIVGIRSSDMNFLFGARIYKYAEKILGNRVAKFYVSNSNAGMQYNCSIGYERSKMKVIANGLDGPVVGFDPPFKDNVVIRLGLIGRLWPVKDIPTMLHAFALLVDEIDCVELHIYGEGDAAYKKELLNICSKLKIEGKVYWKGWVASPWIALEEIDILVSSSYSEGMSNTLMEGLAAGRVVVSTDVGDAKILLDGEHGRSGYLVPPCDASQLCKELSYAINNPEESLKYALLGREIMEKYYSIEAMVVAYDKLYSEISI